jgi:hypothetical protein
VDVRSVAEHVHDFKGRGHLPGDPVRVDGVDERHGRSVRQFTDEPEGNVEVALDLEHAGAMDKCLRELAECDLALGNEDGTADARPSRIGGC